ncbi:MAG TPA: cytochrome c3 family protein [Bryobacteraceae bacterium]|nr:cytochrome c3 family protein [Bryobacteraceae bacterium]
MALSAAQESTTQPIPFSHKTHAATGAKCVDCHAINKPGFTAGFPPEAACMGCHLTIKKDSPAIQKLAEYYKKKQPVPWVVVYQVPDFVWFSHDLHYREAHIQCEECHGPVAQRDVITKEKPTTMNACVACHEQHKASTDCGVCHDIH